ncbi:nucleotidyltransferase family protein [Emticicia sp. TH156]|uniref:nucleotidyltransferase family protein n=1 Tax=Emticicia sp. TH156 TaxID=2067454 RepID=UPI000C7955A9|nr:nucleotidyltransferase domain-containing protein [Emticicia sp. TH156]PLK45862.1 nucleotidyltransferase [Emticicia sp. TH156]
MHTRTINIIRNYFRNKPVRKAYIFGSYARNEQSKDSDLDILVDIDSNENVSLFEFGRMLEDLKELLKVDIDLVAEDGLSKHIKPFIDKDKILIYER